MPFLMMIIVLMTIFLLVGLGVCGFCLHSLSRNSRDETPLGIARKRYAKGEIDKRQLEELKKDLAG